MREPLATLKDTYTLTFEQSIPRHLVHRSANAEVFVTDGVRLDDDRFVVAAQWPRDHALYHPGADQRHDPLLIAETIRQSLVYIAHRYQAVPLEYHFVGQQLTFAITNTRPLQVRTSPAAVLLHGRWTWCDPGRRRSRMRLEASLAIDDQPCGHGSLTVAALDERRYKMIRWRGSAPDALPLAPAGLPDIAQVEPAAAGKLRLKDSIVAATDNPDRWRLTIDPGHAILFDHAVDHVPLMVLLEGARQLGHLLGHRSDGPPSLISLHTDLHACAGLGEPIHLVIRSRQHDVQSGLTNLCLDIEQRGTAIATLYSTWEAGLRPDVFPVARR
jgi:hypothetical protein